MKVSDERLKMIEMAGCNRPAISYEANSPEVRSMATELLEAREALVKARDLLAQANLYVDVCEQCTHVDQAEAWKHVNELDGEINEFLKAHSKEKI